MEEGSLSPQNFEQAEPSAFMTAYFLRACIAVALLSSKLEVIMMFLFSCLIYVFVCSIRNLCRKYIGSSNEIAIIH